MAAPVVVNGDTSLILVNSRDLTAGQSAVVLLSSINAPGRTVTVRDSVGFLSTPQTIVLSTISGVSFSDGTSSTKITQAFGYLTVANRDATTWNLTNSFGFPQQETIASTRSIVTSSILTQNLYVERTLSTPYVNLNSLQALSTSATYGAAYISTLIVGPPPSVAEPPRTDPGYSVYIQGNLRAYSNVDVTGSGRFIGSLSTGGALFTGGAISTLGSFGARGDITTMGNILAPQGSVVANNLEVRSNATFGGQITFSNALFVGSTLSVQNSVSSLTYTTSTLNVTSSITMQNKSIVNAAAGFTFSDPILTPSVSTSFLTASNSVLTSNLTVLTSITAPTATTFLLSSTAITNPNGSLIVSSVTSGRALFSNSITTNTVQTSSFQASTIQLSGNLNAAGTGVMNIYSLVTSNISANTIVAEQIDARTFQTTSIQIDNLAINTELNASNISTFNATGAQINNAGGSIVTSNLFVNNLTAASTVTVGTGRIISPSGTLFIQGAGVSMNTAFISSLGVSSMAASTLTATKITVGAAPEGFVGPYYSTMSNLNCTRINGTGEYLSPMFISNVKPAGIGAGQPYNVYYSVRIFFPGGTELPGVSNVMSALNLFPNGEASSEVGSLTANGTTALTTTLYGLFGSNQTTSGSAARTFGATWATDIIVQGTMYGNSAFSAQMFAASNINFSAVDSRYEVTFLNGALRWPYSLNGTTIYNSLNDMSIRNVFYYGGLNFASDPLLKEEIQSADLSICTSTIESLPLLRYKYVDPYLSTFHVQDRTRLGFLATDVERVFPKSIAYTTLEGVPGYTSTIRTLDTQQIEMAHIGATQQLLQRVSTLSETVAALKNLLRG
jgi:hypothetical protein